MKFVLHAASLLALLACLPAHAMYRCGNTFQDKPCANSDIEVRLSPSGRPAPSGGPAASGGGAAAGAGTGAAAASPFAQVCARIGQDAQKVAWKREAGATQEKQVAELPPNGARNEMMKTIASVYSRRGSAPEIKAAVEAECRAEKQMEADKAAALAALQPQGGARPPAAAPAAAGAAPEETRAQAVAKAAGADPRCPGLRQQEGLLKDEMRVGGSAKTMEALNDKRRKLDRQISDARC